MTITMKDIQRYEDCLSAGLEAYDFIAYQSEFMNADKDFKEALTTIKCRLWDMQYLIEIIKGELKADFNISDEDAIRNARLSLK